MKRREVADLSGIYAMPNKHYLRPALVRNSEGSGAAAGEGFLRVD